jgi:hypothetical protein
MGIKDLQLSRMYSRSGILSAICLDRRPIGIIGDDGIVSFPLWGHIKLKGGRLRNGGSWISKNPRGKEKEKDRPTHHQRKEVALSYT